jgi:NADH:ubiquinone oxidoreductase subunit E
VTEECLAGCDYAPCMLVNEKLHKRVSPDDVDGILDDPNNDRLDIERSDLFDGVK